MNVWVVFYEDKLEDIFDSRESAQNWLDMFHPDDPQYQMVEMEVRKW